MRVRGSVVSVVLGGRVPPGLGGLLTSILTNFLALALFGLYFGPWLVTETNASVGQVSAAYLVAGGAGVVGGYLGGRLADRFGPRRVVAAGASVQVLACAGLLLPGIGAGTAAALLVAITGAQPVRGVAQRSALAGAAPTGRREVAFAGYRLAVNVGALLGPLIGAALLTGGWWVLHTGTVGLFAVSLLIGLRTAPGTAGPPGDATAAAGPSPTRSVLRDRRLWILFAATVTAWTVMYAYERVLPIVLTQGHDVAPATWGLIYSLGPALVILFQLRVTRWLSGLSSTSRLVTGVVVMGSAFLVLAVALDSLIGSVGVLALLVVLFIAGDLIWGPASEDAAVALAPPGQRGAYLGVVTASVWLGSALAPGIGLPVWARFGELALWAGVAAVGVLSAGFYLANGRTSRAAAEISS